MYNAPGVSRYDPSKHRRRSIRLKGYDYTQPGAYFVTLVTRERACLFGHVVDCEVRLSQFGHVVRDEWLATPDIREEITLDEFVIMPNHLHGIVHIDAAAVEDAVGPHGGAALPNRNLQTTPDPDLSDPLGNDGPALRRPPRSLGSLIAGFKSAATKRINILRNTPGVPVWQANYYEHIIRNERSLNAIREYIMANPARWDHDPEYQRPVQEGRDQASRVP
jgi:putative transposase